MPHFYNSQIESGQQTGVSTSLDIPSRVTRHWVAEEKSLCTHSVVHGENSTFKDMALMEVTRGCIWACRFCTAGFIYRPPRLPDLNKTYDSMNETLGNQGKTAQTIGLVGPSVTDHPQLPALAKRITNEGKKHKLYSYKPHKFTTPAFNYDEVETPPNNAILLASNKINKFEALHFTVGNSEIWGLQYHPEIPYDYMIKLIKHRSQGLIDKNIFKNQNEINQHIDSIEHAKAELKDEVRMQELKNWLDYLKR